MQLLHAQGKNAREQAEHVNKHLEKQDERIAQLGTQLDTELAAIQAVQDQFSARLELVEDGLAELRDLFKEMRNEVSAAKTTYAC
jgi:ABC-type transporter Mla subunit MlaD